MGLRRRVNDVVAPSHTVEMSVLVGPYVRAYLLTNYTLMLPFYFSFCCYTLSRCPRSKVIITSSSDLHILFFSRTEQKYGNSGYLSRISKWHIGGNIHIAWGFPSDTSGKDPTCQCRSGKFEHWVGKIPWNRKWQPIPVVLHGKFHGQRSQAGCAVHGVTKSQTQLSNWALAPANRMTYYILWCIWKEKMRSSRGRMEITILGSTLSRIIKYKVQGNGWGCLKTLHLYLCFGRGGQITHRNFIIDNCACHMKWLSIYPFSLSLSLYIYIYLHHSVEGWKILCTNMCACLGKTNQSKHTYWWLFSH